MDLIYSEHLYRSLFENMLDGFAYCKMIYDEQNNPVDFIHEATNPAFEKLTGLKDVVGKKVTEVVPGIYESNPELFVIYGRVASTGRPERFETFVSGLGIWFSVSAYSTKKGYFSAVLDNITDRKMAQDQIIKERNIAHQYLDIAGVMLVVINKDQKVSLINKKGAQILGVKPNEAIGKNWFDNFLPKSHVKQTKEVFNKLMKGDIEPVEYYENSVVAKDGQERIIAFHNNLITDGEIIATISSGEDITERKKAEEQIRRIEKEQAKTLALLNNIYDNAPIGLAFLDTNLHYVRINNAMAEINGIAAIDHIGKTVGELLPEVAPSVEPIFRQIIKTGKPVFDIEISGKTPARPGDLRWWLASYYPIADDGKILGIELIVKEITESKKAEEEIKSRKQFVEKLIESIDVGVSVFNFEHKRIMVNNTYAKMLGFSKEELLNLSPPLAYWPPEHFDKIKAAFDDLMRGKLKEIELVFMRKNGERFPVLISPSYIKNQKGEIIYYISSLRDLTDRKKAEEKLKQTDIKIRKAYVEVFSAVTGGKLIIMTPEEIIQSLTKPISAEIKIKSFHDISKARENIREIFNQHYPNFNNLDEIILAADEALANAIKHAHSGRLKLFKNNKVAQILISDNGPGIDFKDLPRATLLSGYSTKKTLGVGFDILLAVSNRVLLSTQTGQTKIVLEINTLKEATEAKVTS